MRDPVKHKISQRRWQIENRPRTARWHRERRRERRAFIQKYKSHPCADCGGVFDPVCMDFDHRPGETKRFSIAESLNSPLAEIMDEIAKCDVVCANCHRLRTHSRADHMKHADRSADAAASPCVQTLLFKDGAS